jgi:hypothetical protein
MIFAERPSLLKQKVPLKSYFVKYRSTIFDKTISSFSKLEILKSTRTFMFERFREFDASL